MAFGIGASELALLAALLFGGGGLSGIGVPLPPDAGLQSAAPAECLAYAAHNGSATPDPKSTNQVEQLLAEPEVVGFSAELTRLAEEALKRIPAGEEPARTAAATLPTIAQTLLSRPSMSYVSSVVPNPIAPDGRAGFIVSAGDKSAALRNAIEAWEQLYLKESGIPGDVAVSKEGTAEFRKLPTPPGVPPVVWGADGDYVFITIGDGEAADLVKRLNAKGPVPTWLARLHEDAAIPRLGDVLYVDVPEMMKLVDALTPLAEQAAPVDVSNIVEALGLKQLRYAAIAAGLDDSVSVAKLVVGHDENAAGLVGLVKQQPLAKADFATVPRSADFAMVGRLDGADLYRSLFELMQNIDQNAADQWRAGEGEIKNQIGLDVRENLGALGDVWSLYNSPTEGGSLLTGLCATVAVRDRAKVESLIEQILRLAAAAMQHDDDAKYVVQKTSVGERTISYVQFGGAPIPVAPAWCLTEDRLIVAASPQMVRVHLSRPADAETLADNPDAAKQLAAGDVTALTYADGRGASAFIYSYAQYLATMGAGALEKETGIRADLSKFPSFAAIGRHLKPSVGVTRVRQTSVSLESYSVGPALGPIAPMVGVGAALVLPAVQGARETARQNVGSNNLRQAAVAAFQYSFDKGASLPRTIRSADGKPLLSWRVALLPYIDYQPLYDQFHLDEPWDSPHNKALLDNMPAVYEYAAAGLPRTSGMTVLQIPYGKGTLYETDAGLNDAELNRLPVGRGQTVLFVAAARERAVEWTKPEDLEVTPDNVLDRMFMAPPGKRIHAAMNDGSIQFLDTVEQRDVIQSMFFPRTAR